MADGTDRYLFVNFRMRLPSIGIVSFIVIDVDPPIKGLAEIEKGYADFLLRFADLETY